jgi:protein-disulfide isomerase
LIRPFARLLSARLLVAAPIVLSLCTFEASAQQQIPPAPAPGEAVATPSAPAPSEAPAFPPPDPANFTAASPTKATIDGFLHAIWGSDEVRVWEIVAILKTPSEGVSKVSVLVSEKQPNAKIAQLDFYVLPDQKHIVVADQSGLQMISFGEHPFAEARAELLKRADGPFQGSPSKDLEIVEFADFQCPHCKAAQPNMEKIATDFPKARIVFQNSPIVQLHPQATIAAEYGVCVAKLGGSTAFFQFASAVFDGQDGLSTPDGATLTLNSSATKVGLDPAKVAECASKPETKATVDASVKLASDVGITSVPTIMVNGRPLSATIPYADLKKLIEYQAKQDGAAQ